VLTAGEPLPEEIEIIPTDRMLFVVNKSDVTDPKPTLSKLQTLYPNTPSIAVSAREKTGLRELAEAVAGFVSEGASDDALVTSARHEDALRRTQHQIHTARQTLAANLPAELIAVDAHGAMQSLGELTGSTTREEIIAGIFSRFCIGK
jgi:tRNA modification GTPase